MPLKRGRQALETLSQTSDTSSFSSTRSTQSQGTSHRSAQSTNPEPSTSPFKRFFGSLVGRLPGSSRKRPRLESNAKSDRQLALTSDGMEPASVNLPWDEKAAPPASGFLDLTPSKSSSTAAHVNRDTPLLLSSQEGAIRDPLGRTSLASSPSTSAILMPDTRGSSEEAAEMQIQHTSPPSSPMPSATLADSDAAAADSPGPAKADSTAGEAAIAEASQPTLDTQTETNAEAQPESASDGQLAKGNQPGSEPNGPTDRSQVEDQPSNSGTQPDQDLEDKHEADDGAPAQDNTSTTDSGPQESGDDDTKTLYPPLPTDADVDHIQMVADAKVGEHVEGLLDWSGTLSTQDRHPPSAPASEASRDSEPASNLPKSAQVGNGAAVVDLVSDSEDSSSGQDDPDKENDGSLVNATPRLDSDASLPSVFGHASTERPSQVRQSRYSFLGPMSRGAWNQQRQEARNSTQLPVTPAQNGFDSADTSATEQVRSIGRQRRFFAPSRLRAPESSTPQRDQPPQIRNRSASFSSDVSMLSVPASSTASSIHRKRDPIFLRQHLRDVSVYNSVTLKRSISIALNQINRTRSSGRKPRLSMKQFGELANYTERLHKVIARDNPKDAKKGDYLDQLTQRLMRQKQIDAQTAILPLPREKMEQRQRLEKEQRARMKKLRGVLGRNPLPEQLTEEQDRAATAALRKPGRIADVTGASVDDKDLQKLRPGAWLNDEVINFYGQLILMRADQADKKRTEAMAAAKDKPAEAAVLNASKKNGKGKVQRPYDSSLDAFWRVHFFSSFFYNKLKDNGYAGVKRWTRRIDIFSKDIILFPINLGNMHWTCGAINMRKHRFEYYDSMGTVNNRAFELMRMYVTEEARDKKKKEIDLRGWRNVFSDETPQQENGYDCGVFAAQTLEQISRRDPHTPIPLDAPVFQWKDEGLDEGAERLHINGADNGGGDEFDDDDDDEYEWNFSQENMPYLRRRMAYEISSKQLLD